MPKRRILQLGASDVLVHTIRVLKDAGYEVYVVDRNPKAPGFTVADQSAPVDFSDVDALTEYARTVKADLILAVNEPGVMPAATASRRLGLPNVSPEVALQNLDKGIMRNRWKSAGLPQPEYWVVTSPHHIPEAAHAVGFPLILKPALSWGSRGVSLVCAEQDLEWAIEFACANSTSGRFIVERHIQGTEMTIEGLVRGGKAQVLAKSDKEHQEHPKYRVAMALNYPARFPRETLDRADELVARAVAALNHDNGAFHCECMVHKGEVLLLESAARGGGGYVFSRIVEAVCGVCMPAALVKILLGEEVDIRPRFQRGACYKFFSPPLGEFRGVHGIEEARRMPGILDVAFSLAPGAEVEPVAHDAARPGLVVSTGATREEAIANADRAIASIAYDMA